MKGNHKRSIKSTTITIAAYLKDIRAVVNDGYQLQDCARNDFSPEEQVTVATVLANMEGIIDRYRDELNIPKEEIDLKWEVYVLAEMMENLVHDMSADRLDKKYGQIGSAEDRERISKLQEELREQICLLKDVSRVKDRSS